MAQMTRLIITIDGIHQGVAVGPNLHRQTLAFGLLFGQTKGLGAGSVTLIPLEGNPLAHPSGIGFTELIESGAQSFEHKLQTIEGANGSEHMGGISPLFTPYLNPSAQVAHF